MFFDYYSIPFAYYMSLLSERIKEIQDYRKEFWQDIDARIYNEELSIEYLNKYQFFLEKKIEGIISKYTIGYWLHLSRRVAPSSGGDDKRAETVLYCFNILNAAIQKYAVKQNSYELIILCEENIPKMLKGLYLTSGFTEYLPLIKGAIGQFVLADFDEENLLEFINLKMLVYEIWFSGAKKRIISKGANLVVNPKNEDIIDDNRSAELNSLVTNFDRRLSRMQSSATGTVFQGDSRGTGTLIMCQVFSTMNPKYFKDSIADYLGLKIVGNLPPNFTLETFPIRAFVKAHLPLNSSFIKQNNVSFEYVVGVIADLCLSYISKIFVDKNHLTYINIVKRGYQLYKKDEYVSMIKQNWGQVMEYTGIEAHYDKDEIDKAICFLTLTENNANEIRLPTAGPFKIIIPWDNNGAILIDHSISIQLLYNIFHNIPMAGHNFRGDTLEEALKVRKSYLPTNPCKGFDNSSKQIDFSILVGDVLVIAECKVVARSFGILGGDARAIAHRTKSVVEKGLTEVDDKAEWLILHPKGTNYDLGETKFILPLVVSPFTEFIHSFEPRYWLSGDLPRVLNITEFEELISSGLKEVGRDKMLSISN
ncbi:hypothetical protein IQ31_05092 [Sphingobacterium siyangense]|uniref:Uncharacterized protein n=2 Tax=Sphingobacterium siyangense TaxID=459529 RepID=A0A562M6M4_9SPHI|nr:hypothetical protein IQ31_05092 [Sphingobacterium siyangense]